jgi:hypothetical protein
VWSGEFNLGWRQTFVYGEPRAQDRHLMWTILRRLKLSQLGPWIMVGDFNEVLWPFEHFSSCRRSEKQMLECRDVLFDCDLHDIGFKVLPWTFDNKQQGDRNVKVCLDPAVATPGWSQLFPEVRTHHLITSRSDHCPIFLPVEMESNY